MTAKSSIPNTSQYLGSASDSDASQYLGSSLDPRAPQYLGSSLDPGATQHRGSASDPGFVPNPGTPRNAGSPRNSGAAFGKALDAIGTVIIALAIILCLGLAVPKFFGVNGYTVLTGSMEPTIPVGSLVMVKYAAPQILQPGDVVVFYDGVDPLPVTHRLVQNDTDKGIISTQGDANDAPDPMMTPYANIIGKVLVHIPFAGRLLAPLSSLPGKLSLIAIILGGMLLSMAGKRAGRQT